jgi:hypothetical protein
LRRWPSKRPAPFSTPALKRVSPFLFIYRKSSNTSPGF